jgi:hypothetical protein
MAAVEIHDVLPLVRNRFDAILSAVTFAFSRYAVKCFLLMVISALFAGKLQNRNFLTQSQRLPSRQARRRPLQAARPSVSLAKPICHG